jgi:hypothetical protein
MSSDDELSFKPGVSASRAAQAAQQATEQVVSQQRMAVSALQTETKTRRMDDMDAPDDADDDNTEDERRRTWEARDRQRAARFEAEVKGEG